MYAIFSDALHQTPNPLVWLLFMLLFVPVWRQFSRLLDRLREHTYDVVWVRRTRWQRVLISGLILLTLHQYRAAFVHHLEKHLQKALPDLMKGYFGPILDVDPSLPVRRLLVVGEVGDGKSTMINALRDPARSLPAKHGRAARGVTKAITSYVGLPINGQRIELLDTPGVGDMDITPTALISLLEERLGAHNQGPRLDGVIATSPVADGRMRLGAQVVQAIVEKGFLGGDKWSNIILVGTKNDRAEDEEQRRFFRTEIMQTFFAHAPGQSGAVALVSQDDYAELRRAIATLPGLGIVYVPPDASEMAALLAEKMGFREQMEDFSRRLEEAREQIREEYREQLDRQKKEAAAQQTELRLALEKQLEEDKLSLMEELKAKEDEARTAHGAAKALAEQQAKELEGRLERLIEDQKAAIEKQRTVDQAARDAEVADLNDKIGQLRRKLAVLEDSKEKELAKQKELLRVQQEQLMAQLKSKEAELHSKLEEERETGVPATQLDADAEPASESAVEPAQEQQGTEEERAVDNAVKDEV